MILELLGLGVLGAIGKAIYDEGKKEQSSNNTIHNYQQQNNKQATSSSIPQSDLQGEIRQLELNSNIGSIIDDNGCIYDIIFTPNTFKGFPNNMPKVNDQVMFTKKSVNGRLYASNIRYLTTGDDIFNCMRTTKNSDNTIQSEPIKHVYQEKCEKDNNLNYYNVLSSYIKKYELRVYNPDRILEIHNQTNVDTDKIMADLERIFRALEKEKNTISPHVQPSNINYVVHSEPKHNSPKRTDEIGKANDNARKSTEELIMQKINSLPRTFDYSSTTLNNNALFGGCVTMLADILDSVVSSNNVNQLKLTLSAKKQRYNSTTEYNECLENNIVFELYKYDNFIKIFNIFDSDMNNLNKMNYQTFCMIMLNDSKKNVSSAKQLAQNNSFIRNMLVNYSYKDTENREFDYIFSSLKVSAIALAMQSVLYGYIEISDKRISGKEFFKHFSSKNNIAALDTVITQGIANRLSKLY